MLNVDSKWLKSSINGNTILPMFIFVFNKFTSIRETHSLFNSSSCDALELVLKFESLFKCSSSIFFSFIMPYWIRKTRSVIALSESPDNANGDISEDIDSSR